MGYLLPSLVAIAAVLFVLLPADERWEGPKQACGLLKEREYTLCSKRVVTPNGIVPAAVHVRDGRIEWVVPSSQKPVGAHPLIDYSTAVIMPGLVDIHVHLNEPGRVEWEGFLSGTRAAAAGGFSSVVDMPLNSFPVTASPETFRLKLQAARGKLAVDTGFWGGLLPELGDNRTAIAELLDAGVLGLKSFMCPSGIDDFPQTNVSHIRNALTVLGKYGLPLLVHAELPAAVPEDGTERSPQKYQTYLRTRPREWEQRAIGSLLYAVNTSSETAAAPVHIVHLSDTDSLNMIKEAKRAGMKLTVETSPHYLAFAAEDIPDRATQYKCAPPIRERANRDRLWTALQQGEVDMLSSDHSPAPPELKLLEEGDFMRAWGGISSLQVREILLYLRGLFAGRSGNGARAVVLVLQFGLPVTWTYGRVRGVTIQQLANWWSARPAKLAGLTSKGSIEAGKDADFVVWDPEASYELTDEKAIYHRHKVTPYQGMQVYGKVLSTFVRGQLVYHGNEHAAETCGRPIIPSLSPLRAFGGSLPNVP